MDDNSRITYRYVASVVLGVILFAFYFHPFVPYSQRMRSEHSSSLWSFMVIVLIAGFLLSLGLVRRHFRVPTCLLLTLFLANAILIVVDCIPDPTNHNLFPFEFAMIAVLTLPAYLGAWIAAVVDRFRARRIEA
jgi:4-amino-4-deoxy-L-arabinose transferase-like glycosyltransferase